MRKKASNKRRTNPIIFLFLLGGTIFIFLHALDSGSFSELMNTYFPKTNDTATDFNKDKLSIHFVDVGNADSAVVLLPDSSVLLIDAGDRDHADSLCDFIESLGIDTIDYAVATHPHEDHIGGFPEVFDRFDIKRICAPKIPESFTPTTLCYEQLLDAISSEKIKITPAEENLLYAECGGAEVVCLFPSSGKEYSSLNDYSAVFLITFGETAVLMTGDIEEEAEANIILSHDVGADVLKIAHHGSYTSTTHKFLKAVAPTYAVISCGADNLYGHPHAVTLKKLSSIKTYRTDLCGTITMISDGKSIEFFTERAEK